MGSSLGVVFSGDVREDALEVMVGPDKTPGVSEKSGVGCSDCSG